MSKRRPSRRLGCESLESRTCPTSFVGPIPNAPVSQAPFVGPLPTMPTSEIPTERTDASSVALQNLYAQQAAAHTPNVVFLGDSITYDFGYWYGSSVWQQKIAPFDAADYGVPSDQTQNLLWRIEYGKELVGQPKVVVVQIGTNNLGLGAESVAETVEGIDKVVAEIRLVSPASKVLLNGVFPAFGPSNPYRLEVDQVNASIAHLADDTHVYFVNPGLDLIAPDGSIAADFEPDLGHPNAAGDTVWSDDLIGPIDQLLGWYPEPSPPPDIPAEPFGHPK